VQSWRLAAGVLAVVLASCGASPLSGVTPTGDGPGSDCRDGTCSATLNFSFATGGVAQRLDLLVVVDDTPAIAAVAPGNPAKFARYPDVIARFRPGGPPPIHVAFISGTAPSAGCTPPPNRAASCGVAAPDQFLATGFCGFDPDFTGPGPRVRARSGRLRGVRHLVRSRLYAVAVAWSPRSGGLPSSENRLRSTR